MGRFLMFFSYIGTHFRGMQIQREAGKVIPRVKTVQGVLEEHLEKLQPAYQVAVKTSSRTDSNVHALSNTCHFDMIHRNHPYGREFNPQWITVKLNKSLEKSNERLRVLNTMRIPDDFHSRSGAMERSYLYRLAVVKKRNLFTDPGGKGLPWVMQDREHSSPVYPPFDVDLFLKAAAMLTGTHSYKSFSTKSMLRSGRTVPQLTQLTVRIQRGTGLMEEHQSGVSGLIDFWEVHFHGRAFLYKQVRRMMGAMVGVAQGRKSLAELQDHLDNPCLKNPGNIAALPGFGLTLKEVTYPEHVYNYGPASAQQGEPESAQLGEPRETMLQAQQGEPGEAMLQAQQGEPGEAMLQAQQGEPGEAMLQAQQGEPGEAMLQAQQGEPGEAMLQAQQGEPGEAMLQAQQGEPGEAMLQAQQGEPGEAMLQAQQGEPGEAMLQAQQGEPGEAMLQAQQGEPGEAMLQAQQGEPGEAMLQAQQGEPGEAMLQAQQGEPGEAMLQAQQGEPGEAMLQAQQGEPGEAMLQAQQGEPGEAMLQAQQGEPGEAMLQAQQGEPGEAMLQAQQGEPGEAMLQAQQGEPGEAMLQAQQGEPGEAMLQAQQGEPGEAMLQAQQGEPGEAMLQAQQGEPGEAMLQGPEGNAAGDNSAIKVPLMETVPAVCPPTSPLQTVDAIHPTVTLSSVDSPISPLPTVDAIHPTVTLSSVDSPISPLPTVDAIHPTVTLSSVDSPISPLPTVDAIHPTVTLSSVDSPISPLPTVDAIHPTVTLSSVDTPTSTLSALPTFDSHTRVPATHSAADATTTATENGPHYLDTVASSAYVCASDDETRQELCALTTEQSDLGGNINENTGTKCASDKDTNAERYCTS